MIVFTIPYLQIQLMGGAYLIEIASGGMIPFWLAALLFYLVIIIYVWVGGMRAVAWTDIFYGALLFFGMIYGGYYISQLVGGPGALFTKLVELSPQHLTLPGPQGTMGYEMWFSLFVVTAIGAFMGPQIWLRMYSVKKGKLFNLMPFLLGLTAISYMGSLFVGFTGVLVEPSVENPDYILPVMLMKYAPFALASLILAAGASAAMSTANSQIHAVSTVVTRDFYERKNPEASQQSLVQVGRISLVIFSLLAFVLALYLPGLLVTIGLVALGGTAQLIVPTFGALFWKRATAQGAIWGMVIGITLVLLFTFVPAWKNPLGYHAGVWGLVANIVLFWIISLMTNPRDIQTITKFEDALTEYKANANANANA